MWSLPLLLLPLPLSLPPPGMTTVTFFFSSPLVCRPLCPGVWMSSCYLRASLKSHMTPWLHLPALVPPAPSISTRDGVGRKRTELSFTPVTIRAKGRKRRTLILLGTRRWADFHFSLVHLTWSLPYSPNGSTP